MKNEFPYTLDNKRYHTYNYYLKNRYQTKVAKIILDAGFTCPNRDGSKGVGGCIFCSAKGSGDSNVALSKDILDQYQANKEVMNRKWNNGLYIPYFQAFTNTYGPLEKIQAMIEPFLKMDEVCEIAIATRADCLKEEVIDYLEKINHIKPINIELGLQSSNDQTALFINRGHSFQEFKDAVYRLEKTGIQVCVHIMNGLPNEDHQMMIQTVKDIAHLPIFALKIHMLHIIKNTKLATMYLEKPFKVLSKEEYIEIVIEQLRHLKNTVVIERITGDPIAEDLIAPFWLTNKTILLNDIDKRMVELDVYQGDLYED